MILFLAGTSDARMLALKIKETGINLLATVVTESGANELKEVGIDVRIGRLTANEMANLILDQGMRVVVDASHPFAEEASKNAMEAAKMADVPYIRYEREHQQYVNEKVIAVSDYKEAASVALDKKGVIFLATGSKTLEIFVEKLLPSADIRLIARMLPRLDNMEKCERLGIPQKNIVAIQGPFTKEFNIALFRQYGVTLMITKESGKAGSVDEKLEAAMELGIETILIGRPKIKYETVFSSFEEVTKYLEAILC